jgi:hypothetical protein
MQVSGSHSLIYKKEMSYVLDRGVKLADMVDIFRLETKTGDTVSSHPEC